MTTPSTQRKAGPLLGTGVQTAWPFTFKIFSEGDINVTVADIIGTETELVLNTDYSVSVNGNQDTSPGGTVTYPISGPPLTTGSKLTIIGDLDYDQPLDIPSGGNFSPTALENQLDRMTMQIQQLREILTRSLLAPVTSSASGQLPSPEANTVIGWDVTNSALQNVPIASLATAATYGSWYNDTLTGDGTTTTFALSNDPVVLANLTVTVDGLTLVPGADFGLTAGSLVFTVAPTNGAEILARYGQAIVAEGTSASVVEFTPSGGLSSLNVQDALEELDSEKAASGHTHAGVYAASGANSDITSLNAPALGAATATTQAGTDSTTKVATTAQVQAALAQSGKVLQVRTFTDAGLASSTSTSLVNTTGSAKNITPISTNSTLVVECLFQGEIANLAATNTQCTVQLNETTAGAVGSGYVFGSPSSSGGIGAKGPQFVVGTLSNTTLAAKGFTLRGLTNSASAAFGAISQTWTITEVQN
jgi:hypothetical protein